MKPEAGGALAVLTFKYKNAAGVDAVERAELKLAGAPGGYKVEGLKKRAAEAAPPPVPLPVTIPENPAPGAGAGIPGGLGGGDLFGAARGLLGNLQASGGDPSKLQGLTSLGPISQLMADPQVIALASDPRIQAIANDPRILGAIMAGDLDAVMKDPRLLQLANDPKFKNVLEKFVSGGESGGGPADFDELVDMLGK